MWISPCSSLAISPAARLTFGSPLRSDPTPLAFIWLDPLRGSSRLIGPPQGPNRLAIGSKNSVKADADPVKGSEGLT